MKKSKSVHKGNGLLPYQVIVLASQGDILAMDIVLKHYEPYIARLCLITKLTITAFRIQSLTRICVSD